MHAVRWLLVVAVAPLSLVFSGCGVVLGSDEYARIVNDEPYSVDVMLCDESDCGEPGPPFFFADRYHNRDTFKAGESGEFNVSSRGVPNVYRVVRTSDGKELGCLPFVMPEPGPPLVASVSQHLPCTGDVSEDVRWPG
jgi:hypothetical protein